MMTKNDVMSVVSAMSPEMVQIDNSEWVIKGEEVDGIQQYVSVKVTVKGTKRSPFDLSAETAKFATKQENAKAREAKRATTKVDASIISEANTAMQNEILQILKDAGNAMSKDDILSGMIETTVTPQKVVRLCTGLVNLGKIERVDVDGKVAYNFLHD